MNLFTERINMSTFKHSVETDTGFVVGYRADKKLWTAYVYHSGYCIREMTVSSKEEARGLFDVWLDEFKNLESEGK